MISRTEAIAIFQDYRQKFSTRVDGAIRAAAGSGVTTLTINYGAQNVTDAIAAATVTELQAAGWTASQDTNAKTISVS